MLEGNHLIAEESDAYFRFLENAYQQLKQEQEEEEKERKGQLVEELKEGDEEIKQPV